MEMGVTKCLLFVLFLTMILLGSIAPGVAQNDLLKKRITIRITEQPLNSVLDKISLKYDIAFSYNSKIVSPIVIYNTDIVDTPLEHVLFDLLSEHGLTFKESSGVIIIYKKVKESTNSRIHVKKGIHGYLTDKITGKPISNVNVFISNTTIGTSTNEVGFYQISTFQGGEQELIFSHVNYFPVIKSLMVDAENNTKISLTMTKKVNKLDEVVIDGSKDEKGKEALKIFERHLKLFEREFIGQTPNASRCKLLNPWVLDFKYNKETDMVSASAKELLIVENQALGYKIKHLLVLFEYQRGKSRYLTKTKFEEIPSKNRAQERKWRSNREGVYLGSYEHFIRTLMDDEVKKEGFEIVEVESLSNLEQETSLKRKDIVYNQDSLFEVKFSKLLKVTYKDIEQHSYAKFAREKLNANIPRSSYQNQNEPPRLQASILEKIDNEPLIIKSGFVIPSMSLIQHGYWSWKRTADLLPLDFKIEKRKRR